MAYCGRRRSRHLPAAIPSSMPGILAALTYMTPNPQCPVCHGFGGTLATVDDVKADTPKEVVTSRARRRPLACFHQMP